MLLVYFAVEYENLRWQSPELRKVHWHFDFDSRLKIIKLVNFAQEFQKTTRKLQGPILTNSFYKLPFSSIFFIFGPSIKSEFTEVISLKCVPQHHIKRSEQTNVD